MEESCNTSLPIFNCTYATNVITSNFQSRYIHITEIGKQMCKYIKTWDRTSKQVNGSEIK